MVLQRCVDVWLGCVTREVCVYLSCCLLQLGRGSQTNLATPLALGTSSQSQGDMFGRLNVTLVRAISRVMGGSMSP